MFGIIWGLTTSNSDQQRLDPGKLAAFLGRPPLLLQEVPGSFSDHPKHHLRSLGRYW